MIIDVALTHWLRQHPEVDSLLVQTAQLPKSGAPNIKGVRFIPVEHHGDLWGEKPGDLGISFTEFKKLNASSYRIRFVMTIYISPTKSTAAYAVQTVFRDSSGAWRIRQGGSG
jgi:hypothetical protein